jgi:hypothetical protein
MVEQTEQISFHSSRPDKSNENDDERKQKHDDRYFVDTVHHFQVERMGCIRVRFFPECQV